MLSFFDAFVVEKQFYQRPFFKIFNTSIRTFSLLKGSVETFVENNLFTLNFTLIS